MIAGRLTERVKLYRPVTVTDSFGSSKITYTQVKSVHCDIKWRSGSTSPSVSELFSGDRIEILIRSAHEVAPKWRALVAGVAYYVEAVEYNRLKGFKRLTCSRVNE